MNKHVTDIYSVWKYYRDINKIRVHGHSRGSERSGFYIPELKLCLDSGIRMNFEPKHIFITHCHLDHSFALPIILTGISTKPAVYVPKQHVHLFNRFTNACYQLSKGSDKAKTKSHTTIGVTHGDIVSIKKDYYVKVYDLEHNVETRGYGIVRIKRKLKSEYVGLHQQVLVDLKSKGVDIVEEIHDHVLAYICDTNINSLNDHKDLFRFPHLLIECTFLTSHDDKHAMKCNGDKKHKHINWDELLPFVKKHVNIMFHLIHFSAKYDDKYIDNFFRDQCEIHELNNVSPWLN